jgi:hypothetical protein
LLLHRLARKAVLLDNLAGKALYCCIAQNFGTPYHVR